MADKMTTYHTHISAHHRWFDLKLGEVWQYRDLIWLFTKRSFAVSYKQTILGPLWLFINPLLSSMMHTIVFGRIAGLSTDGVPMLLFYLAGNAVWGYFSACLNNNAYTFTGNADLFGKVYFPRLTVPISNVLTAAIRFAIQMLLVSGFLAYYCFTGAVTPNGWVLLVIPVVLLHLGMMGMAFGTIISSLTTKYRDLSVLVGFGMQLWMYATPVVYPLSQLENGVLKTLLLWNPVTQPVELFRWALLGVGTISPLHLLASWSVTVVIAVLAIAIFNRVERTFMDTV